jgi:hypothetical protein
MRGVTGTMLALALAAFGAACAGPSGVDDHWGEAHRANATGQIANPQAGQFSQEAPRSLDGQTAEQAMENYRKEQATREKPQVPSIINIGTGASR